MMTRKKVVIVVLVGCCAAVTSLIRDQMGNMWARAIVVGIGVGVIGYLIGLVQRKDQVK